MAAAGTTISIACARTLPRVGFRKSHNLDYIPPQNPPHTEKHQLPCVSAFPVSYRLNVTRPATIVAIGAPRNARPSKGVLRDLLADSDARNVQLCSVENSVRSAGSPGPDTIFYRT